VTALLRTEGIKKAYGGVQALNGATISVDEGTIAGLIGPNGSGKTTLFNVITGYQRADEGQVHFAGKAITNAAPDKVFAAGLGRTFQLTRIFPRLTVLENMLVAAQHKRQQRHTVRRRAMELLEFVGIDRHAGLLAGSLSYGQRKLLELAYVLVADPAVILLDEPAGGVNPTLINLIADRIRELNSQGKTFLIVEHNMEFVMGLCSTITVLESGAAVVSGPPEMIRTDKRVLDAYLGKYRKNHLPQVKGFWEKFYFRPGNLGYPVFDTAVGRIGVYICYDRHFPEGWRALGLAGAKIVFNPSATSRGLSSYLWRLEQPAAAVANEYYIGAINRVGIEPLGDNDFYGQSYFVGPRGQLIGDAASDEGDEVIVRDLDMGKLTEVRDLWQFYRDRRPDSYEGLVKP